MTVTHLPAVRQNKCVARLFTNPLYMQMKLFCTVILLSLVSIHAVTSPVETKKIFSVQNNFSNSLKSKTVITKNSVRLYPNPTSDGNITISSTSSELLHFYVFDLEGTLLHRLILKGKAQKKITNLKKGTYMYDVFKKDESIEQGKIIVN